MDTTFQKNLFDQIKGLGSWTYNYDTWDIVTHREVPDAIKVDIYALWLMEINHTLSVGIEAVQRDTHTDLAFKRRMIESLQLRATVDAQARYDTFILNNESLKDEVQDPRNIFVVIEMEC